jgi:hypothetical protein
VNLPPGIADCLCRAEDEGFGGSAQLAKAEYAYLVAMLQQCRDSSKKIASGTWQREDLDVMNKVDEFLKEAP